MTLSKDSRGDALRDTPGSWGGGRSGRRARCELTTQALCSGTRFLMEYKLLNPCVFNNKHVYAFHTLLVEVCPSTHD